MGQHIFCEETMQKLFICEYKYNVYTHFIYNIHIPKVILTFLQLKEFNIYTSADNANSKLNINKI